MEVKLGKLAAVHPLGAPKLRDFTKALAPAPDVYSTPNLMTSLGEMLNTTYGDCAIAGPGHQVQYWTSKAGKQYIIPDSDILLAYSAVGGYVPGNPSTDQGCVLVDVMDFWQTKGIGGHQIGGWASLTPPPTMAVHTSFWHQFFGDIFSKNKIGDSNDAWITDMKNALYYFEGAVIGLQLPAKLQGYTDKSAWDFVPDGSPDSQPGSWGGHCVILIPGYDGTGCYVVSWGKVYWVTWAFLAAYMDEARVAISKDILSGDKSPLGLDYQALDNAILARTA
ncbi:MAG TPA: hypothetical protein VGF75_02410 [Candidatus Saccharimonadales bacterium]